MKKYRLIFYCSILAFLHIEAQVNTYSPYSYFGLGDLVNTSSTMNISMGGGGVSLSNNNTLNYINPASYPFLNQTAFEIGAHTSFSTISKEDIKQKNFTSNLSNLGLGFPIAPKIAMSAALIPYSTVGYNVISTSFSSEIGTTTYNYNGSGGLNKFLLGAGWRMRDNIAIGVNWNWFFGSIYKNVIISTENSSTIFKEEIMISISDFNFDLGFLFNHKINEYNIRLGGVISPEKVLSSDLNEFQYTYYTYNNYEYPIDTILNNNMNTSGLPIPFDYTFGLSVEKESQWFIGLDYKYTHWGTIAYDIWQGESSYMHDNTQIILGTWFIPKQADIYNYFNRVQYRLGLSYSIGYLDLSELNTLSEETNLLTEYSISAGVGLPMKKVSSMANLGVKYNIATSNNSIDMINHRCLMIYLSMTLNEKWFKKIKIE